MSHTPQSRFELTPPRIVAAVICLVMVAVVIGAACGLYPAWQEGYLWQKGLLVGVHKIEEVRVLLPPVQATGDWESRAIPLSTVSAIVKLLARRTPFRGEATRTPQAILMRQRIPCAFRIELKTSGSDDPLEIAVYGSGYVQVGEKGFLMPQSDVKELEQLVLKLFYEVKS